VHASEAAGETADERDQVLLGVTGSGKTFTMAKVIEAVQKPTLILAPNKTLAAQLYGEMKSFFPDNAVEYFVSYYDYYQPEAYVPRTDTYIEKDAQINEQIDRMRHAATQALLERNDVVIVASVSCIYGIGSVETYSRMVVKLEPAADRSRHAGPRAGGPAIPAQRHRVPARHVPAARRHRRYFPQPLRGPRLARLAVRRRDRVDPRIRSADRRESRELNEITRLRQQPLRHAAPDAERRRSGHQNRAERSARGTDRRRQTAGGRTAAPSAPPSISK
jgi:hypothetical protein